MILKKQFIADKPSLMYSTHSPSGEWTNTGHALIRVYLRSISVACPP